MKTNKNIQIVETEIFMEATAELKEQVAAELDIPDPEAEEAEAILHHHADAEARRNRFLRDI